jgi:hypothetical protein
MGKGRPQKKVGSSVKRGVYLGKGYQGEIKDGKYASDHAYYRMYRYVTYDPEKGTLRDISTNDSVLIWVRDANTYMVRAFNPAKRKRQKISAKRLIWLIMQGYLPQDTIKTKDKNNRNLKWDNLELTHWEPSPQEIEEGCKYIQSSWDKEDEMAHRMCEPISPNWNLAHEAIFDLIAYKHTKEIKTEDMIDKAQLCQSIAEY